MRREERRLNDEIGRSIYPVLEGATVAESLDFGRAMHASGYERAFEAYTTAYGRAGSIEEKELVVHDAMMNGMEHWNLAKELFKETHRPEHGVLAMETQLRLGGQKIQEQKKWDIVRGVALPSPEMKMIQRLLISRLTELQNEILPMLEAKEYRGGSGNNSELGIVMERIMARARTMIDAVDARKERVSSKDE